MSDIQIIYASTASVGLDVETVRNIVDAAAKNNEALNVSGFLCANSTYFLQCLEGKQDVLESLYQSIESDARHHSLKLIQKEVVERRDFEQWNMGVVLANDWHSDILHKFFNDGKFNPYQLSSDQAKSLLKHFSSLKIVSPENRR